MENACVHLYYGGGKGKTTAAMGLALRCAGCGKKVVVVQFLKSRPSGEIDPLSALDGVRVLRGKSVGKFTFQMNEEEKRATAALQRQLLADGFGAAEGADLLVLDEVLDAVRLGFVQEEELLRRIRERPEGLELVLTGRDPSQKLMDRADYVTRMEKEKHPYDGGLTAREGIEY